jgi:AcrR family transcriptional regulator
MLDVVASVTKSKSPHRVNRAAASARILQATERLLNEGERFTEIPVERLLAEADVSRSTFYVHFADKSALLIAIAEHAVDEAAGTAEMWWDHDHQTGLEGSLRTCRELIRAYRKHAALIRTLNEVGAYDDDVRDLWRRRRDRQADHLAKFTGEEQRAGLIDPDVDIVTTAAVMAQMLDTSIFEHVLYGSPRKDKELAETLARIGWLAFYGKVPG